MTLIGDWEGLSANYYAESFYAPAISNDGRDSIFEVLPPPPAY